MKPLTITFDEETIRSVIYTIIITLLLINLMIWLGRGWEQEAILEAVKNIEPKIVKVEVPRKEVYEFKPQDAVIYINKGKEYRMFQFGKEYSVYAVKQEEKLLVICFYNYSIDVPFDYFIIKSKNIKSKQKR